MAIVVSVRTISGVVIIDVTGRLSFLEVTLRERVHALLEAGHREFVLNLADVPYVDSFGLGQLIAIWSLIQDSSGSLVLLKPTVRVLKLLQITKLDTIFHISEEEAHAVGRARSHVSVPA